MPESDHLLSSDDTTEVRSMTARIWRGWTTSQNADAYERIANTQALPDIAARDLPGDHGAYLLRRELAEKVEFDGE
jgi:hypothetical protein